MSTPDGRAMQRGRNRRPTMVFSEFDHGYYRSFGHVTVPRVFNAAQAREAIEDIEKWGEEFLAELPPAQRAWYVDGGVKARTVLRKLDNPHFYRGVLQDLARHP